MRYQFVFGQQQEGRHTIHTLCRVLQVSASGYYAWLRAPASTRSRQEADLLGRIRASHKASHQAYGSPRIYHDLREAGAVCSLNRIARIMREHGIAAEYARRHVVTTDSSHALAVAPNLLDQRFEASRADTRWTSDITYIWTREGWLYLAVVLDLFSRRIVGWSMKEQIDRTLVIDALQAALRSRPRPEGLICHSDRGSQYASVDYQERLAVAGATCSMSRKGNCYDNAPAESLFASLKRELVHQARFATRQQARAAIFWWIEVWYNRRRRHSSLGYLSPEQFEAQTAVVRGA